MTLRTATAQPERPDSADAGEHYAALDLGSNSFHLIVATDQNGRLQVLDRHREMVRLAEGMDDGVLHAAAVARALDCLDRLGQRIRHLPRERVRVVGTNALRRAGNAAAFIASAERRLGHRIDVVSGREEARLIYLGVSHALELGDERFESRLVVDIGGGSTELILGREFQPALMESLVMGCVSLSAQFFADGRVGRRRFADAENAARQELEVLQETYRARGWDVAVGASGTINAVHDAIVALTGSHAITRAGLSLLRDRLCAAKSVADASLAGVSAERAPVFPGGLAILSAIFDALKLDSMSVSDGALREGLLHDLLGRVHAVDIRETTVVDVMQRYHVDARHAQRVADTAAKMLAQASWPRLRTLARRALAARSSAGSDAGDDLGCADQGTPTAADAARLLRWAALLHELGMDIAHSRYHKHGGYLLRNMDLVGFSRSEQNSLALIVGAHRRKFPSDEFRSAPDASAPLALSLLLRIAVVLHRNRADTALPLFSAKVAEPCAGIEITLSKKWLADHPLTRLGLEQEAEFLTDVPVGLSIEAG